MWLKFSHNLHTQLSQNYRTISLISHPTKVMLRVILDRLVNQAEQILEEGKQVSDHGGVVLNK